MLDGSIDIKADFDVVSVDVSYYGVPWNSFFYEQPLPVSWAERLDAMVKAVDAYELPVMLQFAIHGNDKRSCPPSNASDYPGTTSPGVSDFSGCTQCFDYNTITNPIAAFVRQGFVNYALAVSLAFNYTETLAIINFGADMNRYLESGCSAQNWADYVQFTQQVYTSLKALYPAMSLFPSISLETMMQAQDGMPCAGTNWMASSAPTALVNCAKAGYAALANVPMDAFAFSAFPSLPTAAKGGFKSWYLTAPLGVIAPAQRSALVVANTGALASPLVLNFANTSNYDPPLQCTDFVAGSPQVAANWFNTMMSVFSSAGYRAFVLNFQMGRDTLFDAAMACPCKAPLPPLQPYCDVLIAYRGACKSAGILPAACELAIKMRGTMGVRDLFGNPRQPLYDAVQNART